MSFGSPLIFLEFYQEHTAIEDEVKRVTKRLKELEYEGYQFEGAEGTVELLIRKTIGKL